MSVLLTTIDWCALTLSSIWVLNYAWGFLFRGAEDAGKRNIVAGLFRRLDERSDYHLAELAFLSISWIAVRAIFILHNQTQLPAEYAWFFTALIAGTWSLLGFPAGALVSLMIAPFCERRAIHHNKLLYFDLSAGLEANWLEIRAEYDRFCAGTEPTGFEEVLSDISIERTTVADHHWRAVFLRLATLDVNPVLQHFPTLRNLIDSWRITSAFFSVLEPGVSLVPHRGYYKGVLRYHLGIHVPEPANCELRVGNIRYRWQEGEGVLFDDMYVHSASNRGGAARVVLFLDVVRSNSPLLLSVNRAVRFLVGHHPLVRYVHRRLLKRLQQEAVHA